MKIGWWTRFFWFCSGANPDALRQCPRSEHIKYVGVGGTVFFTSVLASLSGGYAFYTVFNSVFYAALFGLLWGLIIFNLDRFVVSTIKKEVSGGRQFLQSFPRIALAVILAIVIAKPLELRIFKSEIEEILADRKREKLADIRSSSEAGIFRLNEDIATLKSETESRRQAREADYQDYKCECDGTCGTGKIGRGSECARKEQKYLQSDREFQTVSQANSVEIQNIRERISGLRLAEEGQIELAEAEFSDGLVARLSASQELPPGPSFFLSLLILLIEVSPVLVKLLSPRGPYDDLMKKIERSFQLDRLRELKEKKIAFAREVELADQLQQVSNDAEIAQRRDAEKIKNKARIELVRGEIDRWLEEEKKKGRKP